MSDETAMQFGIFSRVFARSTLLERFEAVRDVGFSSVHFDFAVTRGEVLPSVIDEAAISEVREAVEGSGLPLSSVEGMYNMADRSADARAEGRAGLARVIEATPKLGANIVAICSGSRAAGMWKFHPDNSTPEAWRDMLESMSAAVEVAERHGVLLAVEVEYKTVVSSPEDGRRLLQEIRSPALKITIDAANLLPPGTMDQQHAIFGNAFELLGDDIVLAHAKDVLPDGTFVAAGLGGVDYRSFLGHLEAGNFSGPLLLHGLTEEQAPISLAHLVGEDPHRHGAKPARSVAG